MTRGRQDLARDPYARPPGDEKPGGRRQAPLGIQFGELVPWIREHPIRGVIMLILAGGTIATILNPPIEALPNRLSAGDCIYARTAAAEQKGDFARPIGGAGDVEAVVNAGRAVRAACGLSHGHEVSAIMAVGLPGHGSLPPDAGSLVPVVASPSNDVGVQLPSNPTVIPSGDAAAEADRLAIRANVQATCDAVFAEYVGHPLAGSAFVTFAVIPTVAQLNTGPQLAMCLVGRADGQWMTSPARHSGE